MLLFNASVLHRELCELKYKLMVIFSNKTGKKVVAAQTGGVGTGSHSTARWSLSHI